MYKHVFGPVPSRRLGVSLGVDLVTSKSCNLNCIFCECGATKKIQLERKRFKEPEEITDEIEKVLKTIKPDYITFSGSGEPTLSLDLGYISKYIKTELEYTGKICLITNSLLLADKEIFKELEYIDLVIPTLNTLREDVFEKIVRPDFETSVKEIRRAFINLNNSDYKGKIWIEIFILEGVTDSKENINEIIDFLISENIRYDKIQLNTIDRVGADRNLKAISYDRMVEIKKLFEARELKNIEIINSLKELEEDKKIEINQELLDNMKQKRLYQKEEIDKIFKKS